MAADVTLAKLEDEFMKKADERERHLLEQLRAINIDPTVLEAEAEAAESQVPAASVANNTNYLEIMAQIE
mgnify:CR=1 FL=1